MAKRILKNKVSEVKRDLRSLQEILTADLPKVEINPHNFNYHERAEVFFRTDVMDMVENHYIMYVEGINITEESKNCPVLVGYTGINPIKGLFGKIKTKKDSIFIPVSIIRNYVPLRQK